MIEATLEEAILKTLLSLNRAVALSELLDSLKREGHDDEIAIKGELWRLIDESDVELTRERMLRARPSVHVAGA